MPVTRNQSNAAANAKSSTVTTDTSGTRENSERGETSTDAEPSRRDSPENCSICLGPFNNKSFTSSCAHSFCFVCLKQWSKVKAECPLCKQPFTSIFHNIRSNDSYDIYELPPLNPPRQIDYNYFYNYMGGNLNTFAPTHYLSLAQPSLDADLTLSNFSRFQFRHRRYDRYLNPLHHPVHGEHQYSYTSTSFHPSTHVSAASWPRGAEDFRLRVYRHHMGPPAVILGCENSTYRLTPAMVAASAHRMQRIMPWLTRELCVLLKTHQSVRLAISMIQPLLTQVTIDSEYFSDRISPLIGQRSRHFIQEFVAFTNSALNMQAFDRKAMYRRRVARFMDENTSSSSSDDDDDDDVVEVTDISPDLQASSLIAPSSNTSTNLQRSGWDSPTPGPSWETMDTHIGGPRIENDRVSISSESEDPVFRPDLNDSDSDNSQAGSDIVFVKYDKPWNERSPIKLSSDSEGERRSRKKKKVKHKKKRKENPDTHAESAEKGKGHKSSKSRGKEKVRTSKDSSEEEFQASTTHKRAHSAVSSDKQKKKKHKRTKDRNIDDLGHDRDRELVDRLFVEALTQQTLQTRESEDPSIPCSSKSKDKNAAKSSGKERHKRKKKKKNQDRGSASPSILQPYKKHHSGHKKSLDKNNHDQERRRHQHRRMTRKTILAKYSSRTESLERELQVPRNPPLPPTNVDHSMASTFQASYLTRTDTVQHIPLNLWVSTWPSLPVSHTFPAPPSSTFPPPSLPQPHASSSLPSHSLNHTQSEHNSSAVNSQTISSESESTSDSDTDDSQDNHVSSLPNCTRTKQWLDANFSGVGQQPATISMLQTVSTAPNVTRNWGIENLTRPTNISSGPSDDVVSIASGDEDIVVCSSASSTKSDSDEVKVIENSDLPVDANSNVASVSCPESFATSSSIFTNALRDNAVIHSIPTLDQVDKIKPQSLSHNLSPPSCNSFQPFKLHRKSALTKQSVNPFFSSMAHSSDEDGTGETDISAEPPQSSDHEKSVEAVSSSIQDATRSPSYHELKTGLKSNRLESNTGSHGSNFPPVPSSIFESPVMVNSSIPILGLGDSHGHRIHSGDQDVSSSSFSLSSSTSEPVFGVLPPLQATSTTPVSSILPSSLNYLPYSTLSMPTSLSSMLPPPGLPLHFPFPPIQPIMPGPSTLFPAVYVSYSQTAQIATTVSGNALLPEKDSKTSFQPMATGSKFPLDIQNNQTACSTIDGFETSTSESININSARPQNSFSTLFMQDKMQENINGPQSLEVNSDHIKIMQNSNNFSTKPQPNSPKQDLCHTEYNEDCPKNNRAVLEVENAMNSCSTSAGDTGLPVNEREVECASDSNFNKSLMGAVASTSENNSNYGCDVTWPVLKEDSSNSQKVGVSYNDSEQLGTSNSHNTVVSYNDVEQLGTSNSHNTVVSYNDIEQLETSNSQSAGVRYNDSEQIETSNL